LLLFASDGQAGTIGEPGRVGLAVPGRRMGAGASAATADRASAGGEMTPLVKGIGLGVVQVAMVVSLGGELLIDRANYPRVWARTAQYDPSLPFRGRYVSLRVIVEPHGFEPGVIYTGARLSVEDRKLVARPDGSEMVNLGAEPALAEPVA